MADAGKRGQSADAGSALRSGTHVRVHKQVDEFRPAVVIIDPISNLVTAGTQVDTEAMLVRLIDFLKTSGITAMFTNLTSGGEA